MTKLGLWTAPVLALVSCLPLQSSLAQDTGETGEHVYVLQRIEKTKNARPTEDNPGLIERSVRFSKKHRKLKDRLRATFDDGAISFTTKRQRNIGSRDDPAKIHFAGEGKYQIIYGPPSKIIRPGRDIHIPVSWSSSANIGCDKTMRIAPRFAVLLYEIRKGREKVAQENLRVTPIGLTREELKINCKTKSTTSRQEAGGQELVLKPSNEPPADAIVIRMEGPVTLGMLYHYKLEQPDEAAVADRKAGDDVEPPKDAERKTTLAGFRIFDANPLYARDKRTFAENRRPTDLVNAAEDRFGTIADGVSQLIVRAEISESVAAGIMLVNRDDGTLEPLLGGRTVTLGEKHYSFALYTPPETFTHRASGEDASRSPLDPPRVRFGEILQMRRVPVALEIEGADTVEETFALVQPPVVLVHGLFSDPIQTWVNTFSDGSSMAALLERAGFLPFMVNYQDSNGTEKTGSWTTGDSANATSSFADNRRVVWDSPRVDYRPVQYEYGLLREQPVRSELQQPRGSRIGGIKQALQFYRDELGLAATQAIVIGHSMGGLLARVWASDSYNPDYRRPENFMQGDIDRLLTLNTPHHGSELVELKDALGKAVIDAEGWIAWARRRLVNTVVWWFLDPEPGAITDLRPGSSALRRIGATKVPSYAIATRASSAELGADREDPFQLYNALYSFAGMVFFNNRPLLDDFVESRFLRWRNTAAPFRKDSDWRGGEAQDLNIETNRLKYRQTIARNMDENIYYWAARRDADYRDDLRKTIENTVIAPFGAFAPSMGNDGELDLLSPQVIASHALTGSRVSRFFDDSKASDVPDTFLALMRNLVFHQDPENDGAVRVVSQTGGLDGIRHEVIERVVHSYSPWDYRVQRRVLFLLKRESAAFADEGFPAAGQLTPRYMPSNAFSVSRVTGLEAIAWSGMVPAHAEAYRRVADAENVFILARPVNQSSTQLLDTVAAAKGMNIKGKSSTWGPHVGYIPVNQRYSKLWRLVRDPERRRTEIEKYDLETAESVSKFHPEKPDRTFAVERTLTKTTVHGDCAVLTDPEVADAESAVMFQCGDRFYDWRNGTRDGKPFFDPQALLAEITVDQARRKRLRANPLQVLADNTSDLDPRPYLTADYDLLAIGFPFEAAQCSPADATDCRPAPPPGVRNAEFDPLRGYISPRQKGLLEKINNAVRDDAAFPRGLVTHHGPETQYPKSPYVDYPILVFDPAGAEEAITYLVLQGPPGFRDIHLKRFFTEQNRHGYNLWPNPVSKAWRWESRRPFDMQRGYDPRDASNLPPYVTQAPKPVAEVAVRRSPDTDRPSENDLEPAASSRKDTTSENDDGSETDGAPKKDDTSKKIAGSEPIVTVAQVVERGTVGSLKSPGTLKATSTITGQELQTPPKALQTTDLSRKQRKANRCDELAASRWDNRNETGIDVNEWQLKEHADEAIEILRYLSGRHYPAAMAFLADNYLRGNRVEKDEARGKRLLREAADAGNKIARVSLIVNRIEGRDDPKLIDEAIADLLLEARNDNPLAYLFLGMLHSKDKYKRKIPTLALKYLKLAEKNGFVSASIQIADIYERGDDLKRDLPEALRWRQKAAAAGHSGSRDALQRLRGKIADEAAISAADTPPAQRAEPGPNTGESRREPTDCDRLAALAHDPQNRTGVGVSTRELGRGGNLRKAISVCRGAMETGAGSQQTAFQLARALLLTYETGETTEAHKIVKDLAALGYAAAMTEMGKIIGEEGREPDQAATWFLKAAYLDDPEAMAEYALLGLVHNTPSVDKDEAFRLLKISLERKFWKAFLVKSAMHYSGNRFDRSDRLAAMASIAALKSGGEQDAASWVKVFRETWKPEYGQALRDLLRSEGVLTGADEGDDTARVEAAIDTLVLRHADLAKAPAASGPVMAKPPAKPKAQDPSGSAGTSKPDSPPAPKKAGEEPGAVWAVIQNNGSIAVLEEFIRHYPDSIYASLAKARIMELKATK